jgi:hypothetical protein
MTFADYTTTIEEVRRARGKTVEIRGSQVPSSIAEVERKLADEVDVSRRQMLYSIYFQECAELDRRDLEIEARRREIAEFSNDPAPMIGLAMVQAYIQGGASAAEETAATAVALAVRKGEFLNYALLTQIRVALKNRSFGVVELALRRLIEFSDGPPRPDCKLEIDFLPSIPAGSVDPSTIEEYKSVALGAD